MPSARRKKIQKRRYTQHVAVTYYKFIVYLVIVVVGGAFIFKLFTPVIASTAEVLGINTLIAKGPSQDKPGKGPENNERGNPDAIRGKPVETDIKEAQERPGPGRPETKDVRPQTETETTNIQTAADRGLGGVKKQLKIDNATVDIATDGGGLTIPEKHLGARSHFPITIDTATNALIITTPAGTKTVAILPDKAVQNMILRGIISKIGGHVINSSGSAVPAPDPDATGSGGIDDATGSGLISTSSDGDPVDDTSENITLTEEDGELVYKVKGSLRQKFLGLVPVDLEREVTVSAESGEVKSVDEPILTRFVNALSF